LGLLLQDESFRVNPKELLIYELIFWHGKEKLAFLPLPLCVCIFDPPPLHKCGEGDGGRGLKNVNSLSV